MRNLFCTVAVVALAATGATANEASNDEMLALTQNVLKGITGNAADVEAPGEKKADIASLVTQALEEGQSDDYLAALVSEAAESGAIEVPDAMVSTDGEIDTKTLIASLVGKSMQETASDEALVTEASGGAAEETEEPRRHTVASGESLAGIALRYYQDAQQFERIFEANRTIIDRPNLIRVGQIIVIP